LVAGATAPDALRLVAQIEQTAHGSWEVRMGREMGGTMLGGGVITEGHDEAWDHVGLGARANVWHHVALVYDSDTVHFYLDGERSTDEADHGDIVTRDTDVFIGQVSGKGKTHLPPQFFFLSPTTRTFRM
jgi:hypothetical protein